MIGREIIPKGAPRPVLSQQKSKSRVVTLTSDDATDVSLDVLSRMKSPGPKFIIRLGPAQVIEESWD